MFRREGLLACVYAACSCSGKERNDAERAFLWRTCAGFSGFGWNFIGSNSVAWLLLREIMHNLSYRGLYGFVEKYICCFYVFLDFVCCYRS